MPHLLTRTGNMTIFGNIIMKIKKDEKTLFLKSNPS